MLPLLAAEGWQHVFSDAPPDEAACQSGIEVVACAHRAGHVLHPGHGKAQGVVGQTYCHSTGSAGTDEYRAELPYVPVVDGSGIALAKQHLEVIGTAAHYAAPAAVVLDGGQERLQLVAVAAAEVDIVVDDGSPGRGMAQHVLHQRPHTAARGKIRAVEQHVVSVYLGQCPLLGSLGLLLVEYIRGISVVVQIGQAHRTLHVGTHGTVVCVHMVGAHEVQSLPSHDVGSRVAHEHAGHSCTPHTHYAVETAPAVDGSLRLSVAEYDVHDGLAHPYHLACLTHLLGLFS